MNSWPQRLAAVLALLGSVAIAKPPARPAKGPAMKTYAVGDFEFQAPAEGVTVDKIGLGIYKVSLADGGGAAGAWIKIVPRDKDQLAQIPGDVMKYFKMAYLGVELPSEKKVSRQFAGKNVEGDLHRDDQPKPQTMEVYRLDRPDGGCIAINFARFDAFPAASAEKLFSSVAKTLHEKKPAE